VRDDQSLGSTRSNDEVAWRQGRTVWPPVVVLLLVVAHGLSGAHRDFSLLEHLGFALVFLAGIVAYVVYPAWATVGLNGLRFGQWWVIRRYPWCEIQGFELGNPARPEVAYVIIREDGDALSRAERLPGFSTVSPEELIAALEAKRRLFSRPLSTPQAPRADAVTG